MGLYGASPSEMGFWAALDRYANLPDERFAREMKRQEMELRNRQLEQQIYQSQAQEARWAEQAKRDAMRNVLDVWPRLSGVPVTAQNEPGIRAMLGPLYEAAVEPAQAGVTAQAAPTGGGGIPGLLFDAPIAEAQPARVRAPYDERLVRQREADAAKAQRMALIQEEKVRIEGMRAANRMAIAQLRGQQNLNEIQRRFLNDLELEGMKLDYQYASLDQQERIAKNQTAAANWRERYDPGGAQIIPPSIVDQMNALKTGQPLPQPTVVNKEGSTPQEPVWEGPPEGDEAPPRRPQLPGQRIPLPEPPPVHGTKGAGSTRNPQPVPSPDNPYGLKKPRR